MIELTLRTNLYCDPSEQPNASAAACQHITQQSEDNAVPISIILLVRPSAVMYHSNYQMYTCRTFNAAVMLKNWQKGDSTLVSATSCLYMPTNQSNNAQYEMLSYSYLKQIQAAYTVSGFNLQMTLLLVCCQHKMLSSC